MKGFQGQQETLEEAISLYDKGVSLARCSESTGIPISTLRRWVKKRGTLRTRHEAIAESVRLGNWHNGSNLSEIPWTQERRDAQRARRLEWGDANAKGTRITSQGYVEYTRGEKKGRRVHNVLMEERIGRALLPGEVVHHIDGNKQNNDINNLAFCTTSGHARLHRFEDSLARVERARRADGTWS